MIHKRGNLFDTTANYIGHGVNCCGVMGAGIAKLFRESFPHNYNNYKAACDASTLKPGGFMCVAEKHNDRNVMIVNLASQNKPGADADYRWLFSSLWSWASIASAPDKLDRFGGTIAIPEIGCGIGGLEWPKAQQIVGAVEACHPNIRFEVWHYGGDS